MAEYCLKCLNKLFHKNLTQDDVELSEHLELCEGCGQYKIVVAEIKNKKT